MKTLKINYNAQSREYSRLIKTEKAAFTLAEVLAFVNLIKHMGNSTISKQRY